MSVLVPAFNEARVLPALLARTRRTMDGTGRTWEVVLVDDGSVDGTPAVAREWCGLDERIRCVRHPTNRGYGAAIWSGIAACKNDTIVLMAGDLQFAPEEVPLLLTPNADWVIGWRRRRADPLHRSVNAWLWGQAVRLLYGLRVRDLDCGFKRFSRRFLDGHEPVCRGALVDAELLLVSLARGATILEVAVSHFPRCSGTASGNQPRVIAEAVVELFRHRIALSRRLGSPDASRDPAAHPAAGAPRPPGARL